MLYKSACPERPANINHCRFDVFFLPDNDQACSAPDMSDLSEKRHSQEYMDKEQVFEELGDVVVIRQTLTPEEDRRILRKVDLK